MKSSFLSFKAVHVIGPRPQEERIFKKFLQGLVIFSLGCLLYKTPLGERWTNGFNKKIHQTSWLLASPQDAPIALDQNPEMIHPEKHTDAYLALIKLGGVNYQSMRALASLKNMNPSQSITLLNLIAQSDQSVVFGGNYKSSKKREIGNQDYFFKKANEYFKSPEVNPLNSNQTWADVENWFFLQEEISFYKDFSETKISLSEAKKELLDAVSRASLVSVSIPLGSENNPTALLSLAEKINTASASLGQVTGFGSSSLGLNGRVSLKVSQPNLDAETLVLKDGTIQITTFWDTLAHEWFHGLDAAMASRSSGIRPLKTLSSQDGSPENDQRISQESLFSSLSHPEITAKDLKKIQATLNFKAENSENKNLFKALEEARVLLKDKEIPLNSSPWITWRTYASTVPSSQKDPATAAYLISKSEIMAVSFAGFASSSNKNLSYNFEEVSPVYVPTSIEINAVKKSWMIFMKKNISWWERDKETRMRSSDATPARKRHL